MARLQRLAVLGLLFVLSILSSAADSDPSAPRLLVHVRDYAGVDAKLIAAAGRQAAYVFARAGVELQWAHCPVKSPVTAPDPRCSAPGALTLKILPASMSARLNLPAHVFGLALLSSDGAPGHQAYVCYDRVEKMMADHPQIAPRVVLGHVAAHEIGHLLLGSNSHTHDGLMTADWYRHNLRRAEQGALLFSRQQAKKLQQAVAAR